MRDFAALVVRWQAVHGRHDLPWQRTREPYRVWLSEIMLQQTQVATVLAYYPRFVERFPSVESLAKASLDEVLGLWSGLGYYRRACNLHQCAIKVMALHGGEFPRTAQALRSLPGIGPSTAAAIASLCFGERVAILDGNVRRVLARILGFDADLSVTRHERRLWQAASRLLPQHDLDDAMPRYTQGLMDLGAMICTVSHPKCAACPVARACVARRLGQPESFPAKAEKRKRGVESIWLLLAQERDGNVWLCKRPATGVWGGLYCLAWFESREALVAALPARYGAKLKDEPVVRHALTHKDLHLHPVSVRLRRFEKIASPGAWVGADQWHRLGLPAPVRSLLLAGSTAANRVRGAESA